MSKYILSIDQGTTSSRAVLFDQDFNVISIGQKEFTQIFPKPGWVEHNPQEILESQIFSISECLKQANITSSEILSIGITNQRETTIVWEKSSGKAVYNALVWQDKRTEDICKEITEKFGAEKIREKTGLVVDSYFSATKLRWILDHIENGQQRAEQGELLFGTVDTWLIWNLTNGQSHFTDYSNASRTMLFNINTLEWDEEILEFLNIPLGILPEVLESSTDFGTIQMNSISLQGLKITGVAGDQQAALFGQDCTLPGTAKNTYGTGCFMLMNTGDKPVKSENGLLTTIAWGYGGKISYALEGSIFIAGAAIQWLRDGLRVIEKSSESEFFAQKVENTQGVYVVPAFTGLGAPYWNMSAKGGILGITRGTSLEHIIRATLESVAYQTRDVLDAMTLDSKIKLKALKVDGGASNNNFLMKFQADILGVSVQRPSVTEVTSMGAGKLALLFYQKDKNFLTSTYTEFRPTMSQTQRNELYAGWKDAVRKVMA